MSTSFVVSNDAGEFGSSYTFEEKFVFSDWYKKFFL